MSSILIQAGRVVSPEDSLDAQLDVLIEDGVIRSIGGETGGESAEKLDARGLIVSPGFVDLHVHLREPGGEASETLETGLEAAVAGGYTAVCPMPNTRPVNDRPEFTRLMLEKAERLGLARVLPIAAVSCGSEGERLTDFEALVEAGVVAFSDDGRPVKTAGLMREAMRKAVPLRVPIIDHCEDASLSAGAPINEGPVSKRLGVPGIPNSSEEVCLARDLVLAEETGAHLHVAHISTRRAVEMVRAAKLRGVRVTCEVTPHHFTLTDSAVEQYGTNAKMNPPLRSAEDVEAVVAGIADGTVDAIATDHAPHAAELKQKHLADAAFGVTGLETAFALALTRLVNTGRISLRQLILLMSTHPARIIAEDRVKSRVAPSIGHLKVGAPADLTIFDPHLEWTYRAAEGRSKSWNTPFDGWGLKGAVVATVVGGKFVYHRAGSTFSA
jgi:dihydroorotase